MRLSLSQKGFTLIETTIVLALIGLLTFAVVSGSSVGTNAERFGSQIRIFTSSIRDAQTKSYTVQTGVCTAAAQVLLAGGQNGCVWRGNVMKFDVALGQNKPYVLSLLAGNDLGDYAGNSDPRFELKSENLLTTYSLASIELYGIDKISGAITTPLSTVKIAFLSPDGKGYICAGAASCDVGVAVSPFTDAASKLTFHFRDVKNTNMQTDVLFDPANGSISTIQR